MPSIDNYIVHKRKYIDINLQKGFIALDGGINRRYYNIGLFVVFMQKVGVFTLLDWDPKLDTSGQLLSIIGGSIIDSPRINNTGISICLLNKYRLSFIIVKNRQWGWIK